MGKEMNFIRITSIDNKEVIGYIAVEKGSELEWKLVDSFIDKKIPFEKGSESEYHEFKGDIIHRSEEITLIGSENIFLSE